MLNPMVGYRAKLYFSFFLRCDSGEIHFQLESVRE